MPFAVRPGPAPAVTALVRRGVEFSLHPYDAAEYDDGVELSELLDVEEERVLEVVVVEAAGRYALCLLVAGDELDELAAAGAFGATVRVVPEALAERATGQPVDALSPFGTRRPFPVLVDDAVAAMAEEVPGVTVVVASGQAGMAVEVGLADLLRLTGARAVPLAARQG